MDVHVNWRNAGYQLYIGEREFEKQDEFEKRKKMKSNGIMMLQFAYE